jgi:hypothetical protein
MRWETCGGGVYPGEEVEGLERGAVLQGDFEVLDCLLDLAALYDARVQLNENLHVKLTHRDGASRG